MIQYVFIRAFDNYYVFIGESHFFGYFGGVIRMYEDKWNVDVSFYNEHIALDNMPSQKRLKNIGGNLFYKIGPSDHDKNNLSTKANGEVYKNYKNI